MVYRVYVERRDAFQAEARALAEEIRTFLRVPGLQKLRILKRYDAEGLTETLFDDCVDTVFSEPQVDVTYRELPDVANAYVFATEYLPGQFDQRADSAAQCVQLIAQAEKPIVRTANVYYLYGTCTDEEIARIKKHVINPVERREASLDTAETLVEQTVRPDDIQTLNGFTKLAKDELSAFVKRYALAMDEHDIAFCQAYFRSEDRDPTMTELRVIDTYWSDHCRHTTFLTHLNHVTFEHPLAQEEYARYLKLREELHITKPVTLMNLATIAVKALKKAGKLDRLDESDEINACTVKLDVDADGANEEWLLLFKNETHNHPTEIEPFGGAATCIGGAIRDPLSGRAYVYQAMRVTGCADPTVPVEKTLAGKLPQKQLVVTAAAGNSSYGNQIGLATGLVDEIYDPGYAAKHMEIGAVVGAAPKRNVRREVPAPGDVVVLLGGRTGRDGCGGATGSSKSHKLESLETCGAEVQKGNAPEERKLQRLLRNPDATRLIKRCNDFGAGGVSVAIGELADGLIIDLDKVPRKYEGLDGTELAISESQERMAIVLAPDDLDAFHALAKRENLECTHVATVTDEARLVMRWRDRTIVDLSREFLDSNGASRSADAHVLPGRMPAKLPEGATVEERLTNLMADLNVCSKQGLSERFDSTIGAGSVLMPFGGVRQKTPAQAMVGKIPVLTGETTTCSVMAYGYNPAIAKADPFIGAYLAVVESVAKVVAAGGDPGECYLTFQEYFERLGTDPARWGKPLASLLGALRAQMELGIAAIGGKDSMSGSFEHLDVPPTLVSFAVAKGDTRHIVSPEWKKPGSNVYALMPETGADGLPTAASLLGLFRRVHGYIVSGRALAASTPAFGGVAEILTKACMGNRIGLRLTDAGDALFFDRAYGAIILETNETIPDATLLGETIVEYAIVTGNARIALDPIEAAYERTLEPVYPQRVQTDDAPVATLTAEKTAHIAAGPHIAKPRVLIPAFPGTNCEYDTQRAFARLGAKADIFVVRNLTARDVAESAEAFAEALSNSQILFLPGGFSCGDEPDGSGKFITAFLRCKQVRDAVESLIGKRDGLVGGICNGFQALIKTGLLPFGAFRDMDAHCPTLTFNQIGRHQSRLVRTRVSSNMSPWAMHLTPGEVYLAPVSHGEGRFVCEGDTLDALVRNRQVFTQYVDMDGVPSMDIAVNPNGSVMAIEGVTSPDGRILGKMAHTERVSDRVYQNVPGNWDMPLLRGAVDYFLQ